MKFKLEIDCDNAAFFGGVEGDASEVARILRDAATKVERLRRKFPLSDVNGNHVGVARFVDAYGSDSE